MHMSKVISLLQMSLRCCHNAEKCVGPQIPEVHSKLQPYLQNTPCTVTQLRHVIRELAEDESTDIYYDDMEDRVIF